MIETRQSIDVAAPLAATWDYVCDIGGWAQLMPGMQTCDIIDEYHSVWVLKVGVGGMVRTVRVAVTVDRWAGPEAVDFSYSLDGDPVNGTGTYRAVATHTGETAMELYLTVSGSGPLAPMWEAMGRPLLPKLAGAFIGQLRDAIVSRTITPEPASASRSTRNLWHRLLSWLKRIGIKLKKSS